MAILSDTTVSGAGDIPGFFAAPLSLLTELAVAGRSNTHDVQPGGRVFNVGWWAPYFIFDLGGGPQNYALSSTFIEYTYSYNSLHIVAPGGVDGFHYNLGDGVSVRFVVTDD
jgi:hypothetical protein